MNYCNYCKTLPVSLDDGDAHGSLPQLFARTSPAIRGVNIVFSDRARFESTFWRQAAG